MGVIVVMPPRKSEKRFVTVDRLEAWARAQNACAALEAELDAQDQAHLDRELRRREAFNRSWFVRLFPFLKRSTSAEDIRPRHFGGDDWSDEAFEHLLLDSRLDMAQEVLEKSLRTGNETVEIEESAWTTVRVYGKRT